MNKVSEQLPYLGMSIFVGIDVHKKTYSVVARSGNETIKKWTTVASPQVLPEQLLKYFDGAQIKSAYEAGFSGFVLHRELISHGIDNLIVHPASVEIAVSNRVKTDKRDAIKLASLLEAGRLKGIRVPSEEEEHHRLLSRTRQQLLQDRTAVANKIRMKFHQMGLIASDENRRMGPKMFQELLEKSPCPELTIAVEAYWEIWQSLSKQISKLELALKQQAQGDANEMTYRSAPGVGRISARVLSNELGDMSQFENERQLFSYTGLTPSEHSSGEAVRRGHITQQGNSRVRAILVEIAWRAIEKDKALSDFFERLYPRTGKKRAIIAVARKFIGKIRAAFAHKQLYRIEYHPCCPLAS